ncbi:Protein argonaute-2 [Mycena venus]|uniref:Protein argonaute-2 n=1 Tax=Mycena venus TaxID=2733690 RepID=A0A8H6XCQ5_9AGAR|nr:Protein argonaute-2 [Mycena venus]
MCTATVDSILEVVTPKWEQKTEVKFSTIKMREIIVRLQQEKPQIFNPVGAFDGKYNLFSFTKYPFASQSFDVQLDMDDRRRQPKYVVVIVTFAREVNLEILRNLQNPAYKREDLSYAINLLNVFVQAQPKRDHLFNATSIFKQMADDRSIAPLHLWRGVFQSVRPTFDRICIHVDTTVGVVVPARSLVRLCQEYLHVKNLDEITSFQFQQLRLFLRGVKVTVDHIGLREPRTLKIRDLVQSVGDEVFEKVVRQDNGAQERVRISVADHFRANYNITVPPGSLGIRGTRELFPIEFCRSLQQLYRNKLSPDDAAKVLKFGLKNPKEKFEDIKEEWKSLDHRESEFLRGGGITFSASTNPLAIDGRRLDPPRIEYGGGETETLQRPGSWNMVNKTLMTPATIKSWVIVDFTQGSNSTKLTMFLKSLFAEMKKLGISNLRTTPSYGQRLNHIF